MLRTSLVGGAMILALAACATTPPAPMTAAAQAKPPLGCVSDTATRLPVSPNECAGVGSTYTKKDLDQTGRVYLQDALRDLDPAIR
ncbi:MAG TPA: hypothetical protein VK800_01060 [Steroidobacteraceae bacterium]|jgi:hypothetical protein|nr:hypothetical protein [Steroidobacteraceae bacterium]